MIWDKPKCSKHRLHKPHTHAHVVHLLLVLLGTVEIKTLADAAMFLAALLNALELFKVLWQTCGRFVCYCLNANLVYRQKLQNKERKQTPERAHCGSLAALLLSAAAAACCDITATLLQAVVFRVRFIVLFTPFTYICLNVTYRVAF